MEVLLRAQWSALRSWLDEVDVRRHGHLPSGLPAWTVAELVAHLGYGLVMLAEVRPAPPGTRPIPVGDYVAQYAPAAPLIAEATRETAAAMDDVLTGIDAMASEAWAAVDGADGVDGTVTPVVLGRRGPLAYDDFLLTRLLELVVHGDDLRRAVPGAPSSPVLDEAARVVADALAAAYERRARARPDVADTLAWLRLATGRTPLDDPHLPLL